MPDQDEEERSPLNRKRKIARTGDDDTGSATSAPESNSACSNSIICSKQDEEPHRAVAVKNILPQCSIDVIQQQHDQCMSCKDKNYQQTADTAKQVKKMRDAILAVLHIQLSPCHSSSLPFDAKISSGRSKSYRRRSQLPTSIQLLLKRYIDRTCLAVQNDEEKQQQQQHQVLNSLFGTIACVFVQVTFIIESLHVKSRHKIGSLKKKRKQSIFNCMLTLINYTHLFLAENLSDIIVPRQALITSCIQKTIVPAIQYVLHTMFSFFLEKQDDDSCDDSTAKELLWLLHKIGQLRATTNTKSTTRTFLVPTGIIVYYLMELSKSYKWNIESIGLLKKENHIGTKWSKGEEMFTLNQLKDYVVTFDDTASYNNTSIKRHHQQQQQQQQHQATQSQVQRWIERLLMSFIYVVNNELPDHQHENGCPNTFIESSSTSAAAAIASIALTCRNSRSTGEVVKYEPTTSDDKIIATMSATTMVSITASGSRTFILKLNDWYSSTNPILRRRKTIDNYYWIQSQFHTVSRHSPSSSSLQEMCWTSSFTCPITSHLIFSTSSASSYLKNGYCWFKTKLDAEEDVANRAYQYLSSSSTRTKDCSRSRTTSNTTSRTYNNCNYSTTSITLDNNDNNSHSNNNNGSNLLETCEEYLCLAGVPPKYPPSTTTNPTTSTTSTAGDGNSKCITRGSLFCDIISYLYGSDSKSYNSNSHHNHLITTATSSSESMAFSSEQHASDFSDNDQDDNLPLNTNSDTLVPAASEVLQVYYDSNTAATNGLCPSLNECVIPRDERCSLRMELLLYMSDIFTFLPDFDHLHKQKSSSSVDNIHRKHHLSASNSTKRATTTDKHHHSSSSTTTAMKNYKLERLHLTAFYLLHLFLEHSDKIHRKFAVVTVCSCILLASKLEDAPIKLAKLFGYVQQCKWIILGNEWVLQNLRDKAFQKKNCSCHAAVKEETPEISRVPQDDIKKVAPYTKNNCKRRKNVVKTPIQRLAQRLELQVFSLLWSCRQQQQQQQLDLSSPLLSNLSEYIISTSRSASSILPVHPIADPLSSINSTMKQVDHEEAILKLRLQYHKPWYTHSSLCLLQDQIPLICAAATYYTNNLKRSKMPEFMPTKTPESTSSSNSLLREGATSLSFTTTGITNNDHSDEYTHNLQKGNLSVPMVTPTPSKTPESNSSSNTLLREGTTSISFTATDITNNDTGDEYVTILLAKYMRQVNDVSTRCRSELVCVRLAALKESKHQTMQPQVTSFSVSTDHASLYPELRDLVDIVNNCASSSDDTPALLSPATEEMTDVGSCCYSDPTDYRAPFTTGCCDKLLGTKLSI